jgi:xanthine/CO dehydrogenase XdhC/CoxF family maturation factor
MAKKQPKTRTAEVKARLKKAGLSKQEIAKLQGKAGKKKGK